MPWGVLTLKTSTDGSQRLPWASFPEGQERALSPLVTGSPPASSILETTWLEVSPLKACGLWLLRIEWVKDYFLAPEGRGILFELGKDVLHLFMLRIVLTVQRCDAFVSAAFV